MSSKYETHKVRKAMHYQALSEINCQAEQCYEYKMNMLAY